MQTSQTTHTSQPRRQETTLQPQQHQSTNMSMDITTNNTNTRTSRNRRNRNKKNQKHKQQEQLDYIMNYQQENIAKMDFFEKELELLRFQLESCKITKNNNYNSYNPLNVFKYFWN
jgi:hypothetical protein